MHFDAADLLTFICVPKLESVIGASAKMYVEDQGRFILRSNLNGTDIEKLVTIETGRTTNGVVVSPIAKKLYFSDGDYIKCIALDGTNAQVLYTQLYNWRFGPFSGRRTAEIAAWEKILPKSLIMDTS